jgi:histone acetyltransferase
VRRVLGGVVIKPHRARGFLEIAFCVVRKEEQRNGIGTRLLARLKEHALTLGVLHLLTYADDSATGFFEKSGFDPEHQAKYMGWAWGGRLDAWGYRLGA